MNNFNGATERTMITDDQWIEIHPLGPTPGVRYYDGVHRGWVPVARPVSLRDATTAEITAAEAEARSLCRARRGLDK